MIGVAVTVKELAVPFPRIALATVVLGLGFAGSALGATTVPVQCERNPSFFDKTLDAGVLVVDPVDLSQNESEADFGRVADERRGKPTDSSLAPLLYLAPRVESILEDAFNEDTAAKSPVSSDETVAPVAESSSSAEALESEGQAPLDAPPALLRIQREMYRTDI